MPLWAVAYVVALITAMYGAYAAYTAYVARGKPGFKRRPDFSRRSHLFYLLAACLLLVWSTLEWLRLVRSIADRVRGARSACSVRDEAYAALFAAIASHGGVKYGLRTHSAQLPHPDDWKPVRHAAAHLQLVRARGVCTSWVTPHLSRHMRRQLEWSISARYPTDGPLFFILGVLGTRHNTLVSVDDASGADAGAGAGFERLALALHPRARAVAVRNAWTAAHAARTSLPDDALVLEWDSGASTGAISESMPAKLRGVRADALGLFLERGQEERVLSLLRRLEARVLVAHYRDFLGIGYPLLRKLNTSTNAGITDASAGLDPARPAPRAGYNLNALEQAAAKYGYRLVWCLRRMPIAVFIRDDEDDAHLFFPTLSVRSCFNHRASAPGFKPDVEALWDLAHGDLWHRG